MHCRPLSCRDFTGVDYITAINDLQLLGFQIGPASALVYSDTVPLYDVVSTNPVAGTTLEAGSSVDIFVSAGPCESDCDDVPLSIERSWGRPLRRR